MTLYRSEDETKRRGWNGCPFCHAQVLPHAAGTSMMSMMSILLSPFRSYAGSQPGVLLVHPQRATIAWLSSTPTVVAGTVFEQSS